MKTASDRFGSIQDLTERSERLQYGLAAVGTYDRTVADRYADRRERKAVGPVVRSVNRVHDEPIGWHSGPEARVVRLFRENNAGVKLSFKATEDDGISHQIKRPLDVYLSVAL